MFKLTHKIPDSILIAVSGGADSMAALDFLKQGRSVGVLHFNHGTIHAAEAQKCVEDYCTENNLELKVGYINKDVPKGVSREDFWRRERYNFLDFSSKAFWGGLYTEHASPVVTCHHLDDAVETWLFTSMHGEGRLIPSKRDNYIRPFLVTRKAVFEDWCDRKDVPYVVDPSNLDTSFMRNYIRHELMPHALRVNPGIHKVIRKKIINSLG